MEFSEEYAIQKEEDGEYYCPECNAELLYKACEYCTFSTEGEIEPPELNTACEFCNDEERWLYCSKCNLNFNKRQRYEVSS